ncbi:MAG: hypothetical protein WAZ18_03285 [Alphaproteobacteria bacterium]
MSLITPATRRRNLITLAVLLGVVVAVPFSIYYVRTHNPHLVQSTMIPITLQQEMPHGETQ